MYHKVLVGVGGSHPAEAVALLLGVSGAYRLGDILSGLVTIMFSQIIPPSVQIKTYTVGMKSGISQSFNFEVNSFITKM